MEDPPVIPTKYMNAWCTKGCIYVRTSFQIRRSPLPAKIYPFLDLVVLQSLPVYLTAPWPVSAFERWSKTGLAVAIAPSSEEMPWGMLPTPLV